VLNASLERDKLFRRFVRSVIRIFVVFNVEMSPGQSKKKSLQAARSPCSAARGSSRCRFDGSSVWMPSFSEKNYNLHLGQNIQYLFLSISCR
jgi:hypothetical protein